MTTSLMKVEPAAKEVPQALGFYVCIEIWVTPDKIGSIHIAKATQDEDKYSKSAGRVVSMGPDAYKGPAYPNGPWVKIGDHVMFDRGNAQAHNYLGTALAFVPDDKVLALISDPNGLKKINK